MLEGPRVSPREAVSIRGRALEVAMSVHGKLFLHDSCSYLVNPNLAEGSAGKSIVREPLPAHSLSGLVWVWVCRDVNTAEPLPLQW